MSLTGSDRNFQPQNGKSFPEQDVLNRRSVTDALSAALRREFGETPAAAKRIARLVGANPRAVRNWLEGVNAPSGEYLISLLRHSDVVLQAVLGLAGRSDLLTVSEVLRLHDPLRAAVDALAAIKQRNDQAPPP